MRAIAPRCSSSCCTNKAFCSVARVHIFSLTYLHNLTIIIYLASVSSLGSLSPKLLLALIYLS